MLVLSASDVASAVTMLEAIDTVAEAYAEYSSGEAIVPLRVPVNVDKHQGVSLFMPGYSQRKDAVGIKIVSVYPENLKQGIPTIHGLVVMLDGTTGVPVAVMEAGYLTALRTGAASGVATRYLARKEAQTVAVFGAGVQARTQLLAVCSVREIKQAFVYDANREYATKFVDEMRNVVKEKLGRDVSMTVANLPKEAVDEADVIVAATTSASPVINGADIKKGVLVCGVGSFTPAMQEIGTDIVQLAQLIVADNKEAVLAEAGDLIKPIEQGLLQPDAVMEIGNIINAKHPGRLDDQDIIFFKTVGMALLDVTVGNLVYNRAQAKNLGTKVVI